MVRVKSAAVAGALRTNRRIIRDALIILFLPEAWNRGRKNIKISWRLR